MKKSLRRLMKSSLNLLKYSGVLPKDQRPALLPLASRNKPHTALNTTTALCPPKPKLLLSATRVLCVRFTFGT